jgi:hypothetical protein
MKNIKKALSVVLAVVMVLSVMSIVAFAFDVTVNPVEQADRVNIKFEVYQVSSAVSAADAENEIAGGTYNAVDGDIYAVKIYAKTPADLGLRTFKATVKFDTNYFLPLMSYDADIDELYVGEDFATDYGSETSLFTQYPERFSDTRMWNDSGELVTKAGQATVIGLGRSTAGTLKKRADYVTSGGYTGSNTGSQGCMVCELLFQPKDKGAFLNTVEGAQSTEWLEMMTIYFQRQVAENALPTDGVLFGINTASDVGIDCVTNGTASPSWRSSEAPAVISQPVNFVANAIEAPVKALVDATSANGAKAQQIMFFLADGATKTYTVDDIDKIDYRFVAQFSNTRFPIEYDDTTNKITNANGIQEVGFIMAKASEVADTSVLKSYDADGIAALSKDASDANNCRKCWTEKISTDTAGDTAFAFSCRIRGIAVNNGTVASEYVVVPYVVINGEVVYGAIQTSTAQARFNTYSAKFLAAKNA